MTWRTLLALLWALAGLAGCSVDRSANDARRCDPEGTCPSGLECYRGFCVESEDGGSGGCGEPDIDTCYDGPEGTKDVGRCESGQRQCLPSGEWTMCLGQTQPRDEACNGIDDDCDGEADNIPAGECGETGLEGACATGRWACSGGERICVRIEDPKPETCNDADDDCDGSTDEGTDAPCYPEEAAGCDAGEEEGTFSCDGVCQPGVRQCDGELEEECDGAVTPEPTDDCDGADGDCDGLVDEDCDCDAGDTQSCYPGGRDERGTGQCTEGMQTCRDTPNGPRFGACEGFGLPSSETCDGLDDDCDGNVDEETGELCYPSDTGGCRKEQDGSFSCTGICETGLRQCIDGELGVCESAVTPDAAESCNGQDDDCDGHVDEDFDFTRDVRHCGGCNRSCGAGEDCCDSGCTDTDSSTRHCGECGMSCAPSETCCGGTCVDTLDDPAHCGACGRTCGDDQLCCDGECVDRTDEHCASCDDQCGGASDTCCGGRCVNVQASEAHCGECGNRCVGIGVTCLDGSCVL